LNKKRDDFSSKLEDIGEYLQLDQTDIHRAKKTAKNIISMAVISGIFMILGRLMMPGGAAGLYYTAVSIKDFQLMLSWFF